MTIIQEIQDAKTLHEVNADEDSLCMLIQG
jgi:hypothetical protein